MRCSRYGTSADVDSCHKRTRCGFTGSGFTGSIGAAGRAAARIVALAKHGQGAIIAADHVAGLMEFAGMAGGQMPSTHLFQHGD